MFTNLTSHHFGLSFRRITFLLLVMITLAGIEARAQKEKQFNAKIKELFIPVGFDNNDEVTLVIEGYLPDTCSKLGETKVEKNGLNIRIQQLAREYAGHCFDVTVPFKKKISLGMLSEGNFSVEAVTLESKRILEVKATTKIGPNDYPYAPVENARVEGKNAILDVRMTNSCLKIEAVKLNHTGNTVQVLPIMRLLTAEENGEPCEVGDFQFTHTESLEKLSLDSGRHLLHVRTSDGQSVDVLFSIP